MLRRLKDGGIEEIEIGKSTTYKYSTGTTVDIYGRDYILISFTNYPIFIKEIENDTDLITVRNAVEKFIAPCNKDELWEMTEEECKKFLEEEINTLIGRGK